MDKSRIAELLAKHKAAYARRDPDGLAATHTTDGTFESPAYGTLRGRESILDVYKYWYRAFPDMTLTWESALIDPPRASFFWTLTGTAEGPFFGEVKAGSKVNIIGASEAVFSEEGITAIRHVFDFSGTLVRTGVLKVKPS